MKYYQTENGPISQRLNTISLLGVSFGRFGEVSDSVHKLVSTMAEARCKKQELAYARGEAEEKPYLSIETGYIRRRISVAAVSCFGQRLVSRMSQVGDQNVQLAAGRRRAWGMEEERARGEREANWLATVTGRDIVRRGRFWGS